MGKRGPAKREWPEGWQEYGVHRRNAAQRGIAFLFTFEEWWAWWQADNRWAKRGRRRGQLAMARKGDLGPYSPENVYCATREQNLLDIPPENRPRSSPSTRHSGSYAHLKAGGAHPSSKAVITPAGAFENVRLAAEHHGFSPQYGSQLLRAQKHGWRYAA